MTTITSADNNRKERGRGVGNPAPRSTSDLVWLAGLLEGEGYFGPGGGPYPRVIMAMTDEDVVRRAAAIGGIGHVRLRRKQAPHHKPAWAWEVTHQRDAAALMMTLYPFMGERRRSRIREVLAAWRANPADRRSQAQKARYAA